jgi:hypothetical protein
VLLGVLHLQNRGEGLDEAFQLGVAHRGRQAAEVRRSPSTSVIQQPSPAAA